MVLAAMTLCACGSDRPGQPEVVVTQSQPPLPRTTYEEIIPPPGGLVPPGAVIGSDSPAGEGAAITFQTRERPERLVAWYRSPERGFVIGSELQEGAERVLTGTRGRPPREFTVRLAPGINGGTTGVVMIAGS
jgi:hypothetical protein